MERHPSSHHSWETRTALNVHDSIQNQTWNKIQGVGLWERVSYERGVERERAEREGTTEEGFDVYNKSRAYT